MVGTVKKSMAAIASRWLFRNVTPLSASMRFLRNTWHPARDGPLGNVKAKLQQLTVNVRRTPCGVLRHHSNIRIISSRISLLTGFRPAARWRETLAGNADHLQYASADVGTLKAEEILKRK
jgi:hypothetical protein